MNSLDSQTVVKYKLFLIVICPTSLMERREREKKQKKERNMLNSVAHNKLYDSHWSYSGVLKQPIAFHQRKSTDYHHFLNKKLKNSKPVNPHYHLQ